MTAKGNINRQKQQKFQSNPPNKRSNKYSYAQENKNRQSVGQTVGQTERQSDRQTDRKYIMLSSVFCCATVLPLRLYAEAVRQHSSAYNDKGDSWQQQQQQK